MERQSWGTLCLHNTPGIFWEEETDSGGFIAWIFCKRSVAVSLQTELVVGELTEVDALCDLPYR